MREYADHREFIEDLVLWGEKTVCGEEKGREACQAFGELWRRMEKSAEQDIFFPFLYVALTAGLEKEEIFFLAAACYCRIAAKEDDSREEPGAFTFRRWQLFWQEESNFPGTELYYQAHPLLFDRGVSERNGEPCLELVPQVFLFLYRGILPERGTPGLRWYSRRNVTLPYLGERIRQDQRMENCIRQIPGKKMFYLHGPKGSGRKLNYAYLASGFGKELAVLEYEALRSEEHLRDIRLECMLYHGMLAVEMPEKPESGLPLFLEWMKAEENLFFLGEWRNFPFLGEESLEEERQYLPFEINPQEIYKDKELFRRLTQEYQWEREEIRCGFLDRYTFLPGKMHKILGLAVSYGQSEGKPYITERNLKRAVLHSGSHSLEKYAKKIEGTYTMEDLILPRQQKEKLFHVIRRVRNRKRVYEEWGFSGKSAYGNGVSVIFAGAPGTGKTMAAQAVAAELDMELYRVELPAVVDKYIGETEKKLNRIFDEAEKNTSILFFDEADVLFSKRTEIKESNDKYSNMEIAFLLQKMEEYEGVSILATNYLQNFDEAFRRRIHDIVDFPVPKADLREMMWRKMIPEQLPVSDDLDYVFLANQFQLTGSMIKNALIYGSFLAAESPCQVLTMEKVLRGIAHELEKSGKKLSREDYGEYHVFMER